LGSGKYSVGKLLGRGGFGITYLGADLRLSRPTAIKEFFPAGANRQQRSVVPPPTLAAAEYARARSSFSQEAQVLARFHHPAIVDVYDVFEENATAYMVMEYLSGVSLAGALEQRGGPISESELLAIARPLTEALDIIHAQGVLHRDIKPDNVMLVAGTSPVRPVLIDFGAARDFANGKTVRQSVVLTPGYAPLEQYAEQARRGPQTDVYALAATMYHAAVGVQPPAATDRINGILLKAPRTLNPALSEGFSQALVHAMELKIADRPDTAGAFFKELSGGRPTAPSAQRGAKHSSPPAPSQTPHLDRAVAIAQKLSAGGQVSADKFVCPICRNSEVMDPSKQAGPLKCAICRAHALVEHLPMEETDECPNCLKGHLKYTGRSGFMRCPICVVGRLDEYTKRRLLLVLPDKWVKCQNCSADFDRQVMSDTLTLVDAPGDDAAVVGITRSRTEWAELSARTNQEYTCTDCDAVFDRDADGKLTWVSAGSSLDGVPAQHRRTPRALLDWAKIAHGLAPADGSHSCPGCRAQFERYQEDSYQLLRFTRDPYSAGRDYAGRKLPASSWRRLAAGMRTPDKSHLICPACTGEFNATGGKLTLSAYDSLCDPNGNGRRYLAQQLRREDWQRIAAGRPTESEEQALRAEAHEQAWAALVAGEHGSPDAGRNYPGRTTSGETVALNVPTTQYRSRASGWYAYDDGQLWVTSKKLFFHGARSNMSIPFDKLSGCAVNGTMLQIGRWDRERPLYFVVNNAAVHMNLAGLPLQFNVDARAVSELIQARGSAA
jgi:serine/threonine protein kinase